MDGLSARREMEKPWFPSPEQTTHSQPETIAYLIVEPACETLLVTVSRSRI